MQASYSFNISTQNVKSHDFKPLGQEGYLAQQAINHINLTSNIPTKTIASRIYLEWTYCERSRESLIWLIGTLIVKKHH